MFNAKFDMRMLEKQGVFVDNNLIDVLLMAQMVLPDEDQHNLKHLSRKILKDPYIEEINLKKWLKLNNEKVYGKAPKSIILPYAMADAKRTLELFVVLSTAFDKHHLWHILEREMFLMRQVVMPMEAYGAAIDTDAVQELAEKTTREQASLKQQLIELTGDKKFNPNSSKQVAQHIYKDAAPTRFSRKTGAPKTDIIALLESHSPIASLVVQYRASSKSVSTYLSHLRKPIIHTSLNQGGTCTGRFSSSGPNLQNIPRPGKANLLAEVRKVFVARPEDRLLFIDYSQIEMRLAAHFSQEPHMLDAIQNGKDLHDETCIVVFDKKPSSLDWELYRYLSKTLNFSVLYGTGPGKLRETVLKQTQGKVKLTELQAFKFIQTYKSKNTKIMQMFADVAKEISNTGGVRNFYGRFVPVDLSRAYVGVNYKIQGTAADFIKYKMLLVNQFLKETHSKIKMMLQVHDELIFNLPKQNAKQVREIVRIMEDHSTFCVPITSSVSYGPNWMDKKKLVLNG